MRFFLDIDDPNVLGDEEWAKTWCDLQYALKVQNDLRNVDKLKSYIKNLTGG